MNRFPPGPRGHFLLGNLPELRRDPLGFLTMCARDYGDVVRYRVANVTTYLVNHPDYIESVLSTNSRNFIKGRLEQASRYIWGDGLLTSEGSVWQRQRRMTAPAFHRDRIEAYGDVIVAYAERVLDSWRIGETRDLHTEMKRLTLEIIAKTLFDADVANDAKDVGAALTVAWEEFSARLSTGMLIPVNLPTPGNLRLRNAIRRLDKIVDRVIAQRKNDGRSASDLLSMLLRATDDDGSRLTDEQLRDEVKTLFVAGHETTALVLTWTCYLLSQHPQVEQKLRGELQQVLGSRHPTVAEIPRLRYTEMVIKESMRLFPVVWALPRVALNDCEIGGYHVPAGTSVTVSQWVTHRDARYFENPKEFQPERWSDDRARSLPKFAYFPFGGGPRHCLGHVMAMMEAILLLAAIVPRFRLTLVSNQTVKLCPSITLYPKTGMQMIIRQV